MKTSSLNHVVMVCGNGVETRGTGTDMICINKLECNDSPCGAGAAVSCVDVDASLTLTTKTISGVEIEAIWGRTEDKAGYTCGCTICSDAAAQYYTYDVAKSECTVNDVCASVTLCGAGTKYIPALDAGAE